MLKTVLKFGLYGGIVIIILFASSYQFFGDLSFATQEILGYLSMFIATLFVFFGIKSYRDKEKQGYISFGRAFGLGLLITLVPAVLFGIFDAIYVTYIYPEFFEHYNLAMTEELSKKFSGAELETKLAEMKQMMEFATNPAFTFFLMFMTVFIIGFIITLISAIVLRKNKPATV